MRCTFPCRPQGRGVTVTDGVCDLRSKPPRPICLWTPTLPAMKLCSCQHSPGADRGNHSKFVRNVPPTTFSHQPSNAYLHFSKTSKSNPEYPSNSALITEIEPRGFLQEPLPSLHNSVAGMSSNSEGHGWLDSRKGAVTHRDHFLSLESTWPGFPAKL